MAVSETTLRQIEAMRKSTSLSRISEADYRLLIAEVQRVGIGGVTGVLGDRLRGALHEVVEKHLPGKHDQRSHARGSGGKGVMHPGPPLDAEQIALFRGGSAEAHLVPDGKGGMRFSDERQALHDQIVANHVAGVPSRENPTYTMMGGGPASGKSTAIEKNPDLGVPPKTDAVHIDSDGIKGELPEYRDMIAAGDTSAAKFAHEESSFLAKRVQATAFANRQDVVLDGTGDNSAKSVEGKIGAARASGYKVDGHYVTLDTNEAVSRAKLRAARTGRMPPEDVIRDTHRGVSQIFPQVSGSFDSVTLWDNNGSSPTLVARGRRGSPLEIVDQPAYGRFLAKASE